METALAGKPHVIIVGAGFGELEAAKKMAGKHVRSYVNHSKRVANAKAPIGDWQLAIGNPLETPRIHVRNLQRKIAVNVTELQTFAAKAVRRCLQLRKRKRTDLSKLPKIFVWLISDRRMTRLHRQFLGQKRSTDVLTFQHGEIFISVETAKRHARLFGNSIMRELQLYVVHGLLHLHGFDDATQAEARKMQTAQERILRACSRDR